MTPIRLSMIALLPLIAACSNGYGAPESADAPVEAQTAYAKLLDADGAARARAVLTAKNGGVDIALLASGMAPGTYAFHIHGVGTCTPPDFTSAGGHFNPTGQKHGKHKGDLPNMIVGDNGEGRVDAFVADIGLSGGDMSLVDADGAALMFHAHADDGVSDPAGNAGPRIACGVVMLDG